MLDEVRILAKKNKDEIDKNPSSTEQQKSFAELTVDFMSNTDYIRNAPKSTVMHFLYYLGYDLKNIDTFYDEIIKDASKTYKVISPEQLAELSGKKEMK